MVIFAVAPTTYRRIGISLLLLQLGLFVLALPPFQAGIWSQAEPVMLGLFIGAALNALWLAVGLARGWLACHGFHPIWLALLAWIAWQLVATALAVSPYRSWFGPPEMGEGAGWHVAFLLLVMLVYPLWQDARYRRTMLYAASMAILVQAMLHGLFPAGENSRYIPGSWTPGTWPAYLAFMVGYMWISWCVSGHAHTCLRRLSLLVFTGLVLYLSHSKSGMVLLGGAACCGFLLAGMRHNRLNRIFYPGRNWRRLALVGCLFPIGWILFSHNYTSLPYNTEHNGLYATLSYDGSLGSRIALNQISLSAMRHEPWRWLAGNGWGGFTDDAFKYALVEGVHVFRDGERRPNFMMVDGYSFHSHNQPLEALLSLGLPGAALWLALPMLLLWFLPGRFFWLCAPMLLGIVALSFLWFELAQCLPYKALGMVALLTACASPPQREVKNRARFCLLLVLLAGLSMGWSAWQQRESIRYGETLRDAMHALPFDDYKAGWIASDLRRGGDRLRNSILFHAMWLTIKLEKGGLDDNDRGWYAQFMRVAHEAALAPETTARIALLETWMKYNLLAALDDPVFSEMKQEVIASLPDTVVRISAAAPLRDDLAAAFLLNLPDITAGDNDRQLAILNRILEVAPNHRGALWVQGGLLQTIPGREAEGAAMRRRAAAMGAGRVFPIRDAELAGYK